MPDSSDSSLLSRVVRRNSTIEIWRDSKRTWLRKIYHARYDVGDEARAYILFTELLADVPDIRTAQVIGFDETQNSLDLEFIEGKNLAEEMAENGYGILRRVRAPVTQMLARSYQEKAPFDCDPTNLILEDRSSDLVLVDPICAQLNLSHFAAVVFFWGLVKSCVSQIYRFDRWREAAHSWRDYQRDYLSSTGCSRSLFFLEMSQYITTVITWNIKESTTESLLKRLSRWTVMIPLWSLLWIVFRLSSAFSKADEVQKT